MATTFDSDNIALSNPIGRYRGAVALGYDFSSDEAPRIEAIGAYFTADEIVAVAKQFGVPIIENSPLVESLQRCGLGDYIPRELFRAVAIVFRTLRLK